MPLPPRSYASSSCRPNGGGAGVRVERHLAVYDGQPCERGQIPDHIRADGAGRVKQVTGTDRTTSTHYYGVDNNGGNYNYCSAASGEMR